MLMLSPAYAQPPDAPRVVVAWLWINYFMILAMVAIGGITRLTGSGLSIVEWAPLFGAIPPLSEADWLAVFERYKQFPQYQLVNSWMTLADFKRIFFWEYIHRLWGRLIGLVYLLPMLWFWWRGQLENTPKTRIIAAFALGGLQGVVGWLMVMSGLVDRPAVSHIRLAIHFGLALFVAHWILWIILDLRRPTLTPLPARYRWPALGLLTLLSIQLVYGAFMAGSKAGHLFPTFPTMNGFWLPPGAFASEAHFLSDAINNPVSIHVLHRWLAYAVTIYALIMAYTLQKSDGEKRMAMALGHSVMLQLGLGIATVLLGVHIVPAVLHQVGGYLLLSVVVVFVYRSASPRLRKITPP